MCIEEVVSESVDIPEESIELHVFFLFIMDSFSHNDKSLVTLIIVSHI